MRTRERGRRLPDIDVLARAFLRRGLSEHPEAAKHVADTNDIERMSVWELLNLAKTMGIDPAAMIRTLEQEDDQRWNYSNRHPGFQGELELDLTIELAGKRTTRKAKVVYTFTPEWPYFDLRKQAEHTGWGGSTCHIEVLAVPDEHNEADSIITERPYWTKLEDLMRDDIVSGEVWNALDDLIDEKCKVEDTERRRVAATPQARGTRRRQ